MYDSYASVVAHPYRERDRCGNIVIQIFISWKNLGKQQLGQSGIITKSGGFLMRVIIITAYLMAGTYYETAAYLFNIALYSSNNTKRKRNQVEMIQNCRFCLQSELRKEELIRLSKSQSGKNKQKIKTNKESKGYEQWGLDENE